MYEKERSRVEAYLAGNMSRCEMIRDLSALGATATPASTLIVEGSSRAFAEGFDAMKHQGTAQRRHGP